MDELSLGEYVNYSQYTPEDIAELVRERDRYRGALMDIVKTWNNAGSADERPDLEMFIIADKVLYD